MNFISKLGGRIKTTYQKLSFKASQHKPEICFALGVIAVVGGTVLVIKETLDFKDDLDEANEELDTIEEYAEYNMDDSEDSEYTEEDYEHDKFVIKKNLVISAVTKYLPAIAILALGIVCFKHGYSVLNARNAGLIAACGLVKKEFSEYRQNVIERFGEEVDQELRFGIKKCEDEDGNETDEMSIPKPPKESYRRLFDETSSWFSRNPDDNMMTLRESLHKWNDILRIRGFVFVNEILEDLNLEWCDSGQDDGWIYNPEIEHQISFGPALDYLYTYGYNSDVDSSDWGYYGGAVIPIEFNAEANIRSRVLTKTKKVA